MFKKLLLEQIISFENSFNSFIYYLREWPFFEKRISYEVFQHNKFKHVLSIVTFVFGILMKFVGRLVYAALFFLIPYIILKQFVVGNTFQYDEMVINNFFMMNCVCGSLVNTVILSSSDEDYMMLNVLKINPKEHYVGELLFKLITDFGLFFAVLCIFDIGVLNSLLLVVVMTAFRCIGEAISLLVYARIPFVYKRIVTFDVIVILASVFYSYVNPILRGKMVSVDAFAFNPVLLGVIISLGLVCFVILCTYRKYPDLARKRVKRVDAEYAEEIQARARIRDVEVKTNVTGKAALFTNRHEKKRGYAYINNIFFDRNKKLLLKSANKRVAWIVVISLCTFIYLLGSENEVRERIWTTMLGMDTIWFLIMYALSCSHRLCRAMFYNCDKDMMRYSYYTKKSALVSNFLVRLSKFIRVDLKPALVIIVSMLLITFFTGHSADIMKVVPIMLIVLLFAIMGSIYHVAMYHVLQPYNDQMKVKSPLFTIANVAVAVLGLVFMELPLAAVAVIIIQVIAIVALMGFSFVMVKEFGPANFYVK